MTEPENKDYNVYLTFGGASCGLDLVATKETIIPTINSGTPI
jgi:hypothetical protein